MIFKATVDCFSQIGIGSRKADKLMNKLHNCKHAIIQLHQIVRMRRETEKQYRFRRRSYIYGPRQFDPP